MMEELKLVELGDHRIQCKSRAPRGLDVLPSDSWSECKHCLCCWEMCVLVCANAPVWCSGRGCALKRVPHSVAVVNSRDGTVGTAHLQSASQPCNIRERLRWWLPTGKVKRQATVIQPTRFRHHFEQADSSSSSTVALRHSHKKYRLPVFAN